MLPEAFIRRMQNTLGDEYDEFIASYDHEQYKAIRFNPLKISEADLARVVDCYSDSAEEFKIGDRVAWEKNGYYIRAEKPGKHPYHEAGVYYIQEPSAMAPVHYLGVEPGDRVLDLCAAPGGKSTQIAGCLKGDGLLICNEPYPQRAKILAENIERLGVRNAIVLNEYPDKLSGIFIEYFDKILVDAPCSGEGMFRKNEDATYEWSEDNVRMCAERQFDILTHAAKMLKPGGRLVYSTCTFSKEEDENLIKGFIEANPDFSIELVEKCPGFADGEYEGTIRLWPHKVKGEGHFLAVLTKKAFDGKFEGYVSNGIEKGLSKKDIKEFLDFLDETIDADKCVSFKGEKLFDNDSVYIKFGDQLHLLPKGSPSLKGLKVVRPGLHLGSFKKNRFEPAHALAMALGKEEVYSYVTMAVDSADVKGYINGMTVTVNSENVYKDDSICHEDLAHKEKIASEAEKAYKEAITSETEIAYKEAITSEAEKAYKEAMASKADIVDKADMADEKKLICNADRVDKNHNVSIYNTLSAGSMLSDDKKTEDIFGNLGKSYETFMVTKKDYGNKGHYTLMTVDGFSIGWAKNVNGMLKNHYPKGLRK